MKATAIAPTRAVLDAVEHVPARQRVGPALALQPKFVLVDRARAVGREHEFEIDRFGAGRGGGEHQARKDAEIARFKDRSGAPEGPMGRM